MRSLSHNSPTRAMTSSLSTFLDHIRGTPHLVGHKITWGVQVVRYPNFFSGMEADRNVKVVGGDVAVL